MASKPASKNKDDLKRNDLGYLGIEFQEKLVKVFFEDKTFFENIQSIVDQNMFTSEHLRRIVGIMKNRYSSASTPPSYDEVKLLIRIQVTDAITVELLEGVVDKLRDMPLESVDIIEGQCENFFKQQNLVKAMNKAAEIIRQGAVERYPEIESFIQDALMVNSRQDTGFHLFENIEKTLSPDYRQTIPTGCLELDKALYGGIGRRELGVIVAPMGTGKSSATTGFAASAATYKCEANNNRGFKVLHFFFEDEEVNIERKYYGYVLDIDACELSNPDVRPTAIARLSEDTEIKRMLKENIICQRLSTGEVSATSIRNRIKRQIALGFIPDLVIVDYFECLAREKSNGQSKANESEWTGEAITMRKLEATCKELNVAMWVPVQGTKGSIGESYVGLMHAGGSVTKTQIGHVVIQFAQTKDQKTQGIMNVFIGKLRAVRIDRDEFLNVKFNNGTCKFDMSSGGSEIDNIVPEQPQYPSQNGQATAARVATDAKRR